ncbi:helix-turn-helix domain-containing protein [Levilactobacillus sp. N40-8-2]|uniref:PucR family transcriptional regulator n=1 Tax=Levilactobacillus muriae TaxID=3238987 RepID=UPI0038B3D722
MNKDDLLLKSIQCSTIDELTDLIAAYLDQAVILADQSGRIISSGHSPLAQIPTDWLDPTANVPLYRHDQLEFIRNIINPMALNTWYLFTSQSKGYPAALDQVQLAIRVINSFIDRYALNPNQSEVNSLFSQLLTQPEQTGTTLLQPLIADKMVCVTATPQAGATNQTAFVQQLRDLITPLPLAEDHQRLIFLLNADDLPQLQSQLNQLGTFFHHYFFISEAYSDVSKTAEFRNICEQAAQLAQQLGTLTVVNSTQKYNIYIILSQVDNASLLKNTMCSQLLFLQKYDRRHHSDLFKTLFEFLENDCKISVTADQLHLHRNSLTKRLQKVQDLIAINFDDPDKTFGLRLSYRLFNFLQI